MEIRKEHLKVIVIIGCQLDVNPIVEGKDIFNLGFYTDAFKIQQIFTRYFGIPKENVSVYAPDTFNEKWLSAFNGYPKLQFGSYILEVPKEHINFEPTVITDPIPSEPKRYDLLSNIKTDDNDDILLFFLGSGDENTFGYEKNRIWHQLIIQSLSEIKHHTLTILFESSFSGNLVNLLEANNNISKALNILQISFDDFSNNLRPYILFRKTSYTIDDFKEISTIVTKMDMVNMQDCYEMYQDKQCSYKLKYLNMLDMLQFISKLFKGACISQNLSNPKTTDLLSLYQPLLDLTPREYSEAKLPRNIHNIITSPNELQIFLSYLQYLSVKDYSEFCKLSNFIKTIFKGKETPKFLRDDIFQIQCFSEVNFDIIQKLYNYEKDYPNSKLTKSFVTFSATHNNRKAPNLVNKPVFVDRVVAISSTDDKSKALFHSQFCSHYGGNIQLGSVGLDTFLKYYIICKEAYPLNKQNWRHFLKLEFANMKYHESTQPGYVYSMNFEFTHLAKLIHSLYSDWKVNCLFVLENLLGWRRIDFIDKETKPIENCQNDSDLKSTEQEKPKKSEQKESEVRKKLLFWSEYAYSPWPDYEDERIMRHVVDIIDYMNMELEGFGLFFDPFSRTAPYSVDQMSVAKVDLSRVFRIYQDANSRFMVSQSPLFTDMAPALANFIRLYDYPYGRVKKYLVKASLTLFGKSKYNTWSESN